MSTDLQTKNVTLSNGLVLTLSQSNWRISRKKDRLETEMEKWVHDLEVSGHPLDHDDTVFALNFYPLLAPAVISNNCPSVQECLDNIKETDLNIWYEVAREMNPHWFSIMDKIVELAKIEEDAIAQEVDAETAVKKDQMKLDESTPIISSTN